MKKSLLILCLIVFVASFDANAQIRWPFGNANEVTVTSADTVDPGANLERGINYLEFEVDTNIVFEATGMSSSLSIGDLMILKATGASAPSDADTISYSTGVTGLDDPIPVDKTRIIQFLYDGSGWVKQLSTQID